MERSRGSEEANVNEEEEEEEEALNRERSSFHQTQTRDASSSMKGGKVIFLYFLSLKDR